MKIIKTWSIFFIFNLTLISCSSLGEAGKILRNEKTASTDEFLIKKQQPLTQPPDFDKIPEPGSIKTQEVKENSFEQTLKNSKSGSSNSRKKSSSVENSILNKIKK
jgi:hypothetical protein|tara:strand:+ start:193 stop:510 length:318 start_codon:yes stop_codon:yes gene_type:complete